MPGKPSYKQLESRLKKLENEVLSYQQQPEPLQQNKENSSFLFEKLPIPYQSLDMEGRILKVNQLWLDFLGYTRQEIIGTFFADILHPDDSKSFQPQFLNLKSCGSASKVQFKLLKKNGTLVHVSFEGIREHNAACATFQTHCFLLDMTEYKRLESIQRSTENVWERTFDATNDIVTIQDRNLTIVRANKAAHNFFNANNGDLYGKYCYEVFTGKSEPCSNCPLLTALEKGTEHSAVIYNKKLDKVFQLNTSLIPAINGGEEYLVHVARDVTTDIDKEKILQESNERFSKAFESNPAPMVISEIDSGLFVNVNQRWIEMLGYSREELIGKTSKDVGIWRNPAARDHAVAKLSTRTSFNNYHIEFITKSGEIRFALWSMEKITIHGHELMLSLITDITERKKAETKLQESEEKFFLAFNSSPDAININRFEDGLYVDVNGGFTELTGFTEDDIQGKTSSDINIWHDPADRLRLVQNLKKNGYCENLEANFRKKDGSIIRALMSARVLSLNNVPHIISITRDISKLRQIEQEVLEQKLLFETMFNAITDGVIITDNKRRILLVNKGMESTFGYLPDELKGKTTECLYADSEKYQTAGKKVYSKESQLKDRVYVTEYKHKSGVEFPGETFGSKLFDNNNKWIGNLGIMRDISLRQKTETERDRLIAAVEQTRDAIVITNRKANIKYVNPAFETVTGYTYDEVLNQNPCLLKSGEQDSQFYQEMWQTLNQGKTFKGRMVNKRKNGSLFTEEATISPILDHEGQVTNFVGVKRDITEQTLLETQLQQAQKMEAVGRLTGGVAHDFNNILGIIIGYTEIALEDVNPSQKLYHYLRKILDASERSANIVRQLLAFSRKQTISPKVFDLNTAVISILKMLHRLIGEDIDLSWLPGPDTLLIKMDPTQIDQILANLCVNAKDAINGTGKITIETMMVTFDEEYCASHIGFHPGKFVLLSISDNGCGIEKEAQNHIFEPFYSTKEPDGGTGLGLSTVYGIVKQNNGFINVYSEPGEDTTFKIYIPSSEEGQQEPSKKGTTENRESQGETVLLVEDEPLLLEMAQQMLQLLGYTVLIADRPEKALKIAKDYPENIDLVLTDVVMPEMSGKEMVSLIQPLHPKSQVLFMSGYTANVIAHNGVLDDGIHFIQKPYSVDELAHKIRNILNVV